MIITTHPHFEYIRGSERARLVRQMVFTYKGHTCIVPVPFETDFASTPRLFWSIVSPTDCAIRSGSVPHDFGFQHGYMLAIFNPAYVYPKKSMELRRNFPADMKKYVPVFAGEPQSFFDSMFRDVNLSENETFKGRVKIEAAYCALRCAGFVTWNKYRRRGPAAFNQNSLDLPGL